MSLNSNSLMLFLIHLCVVCAAAVTFSGANEFRNDYDYYQDAGGWFKLHRVPVDWENARMQCYYEGAVLASPLDSRIWSALKKIVSEAKVERLHSGVHATFSDGQYSSLEGVPLEQLVFEWLPKQPDSSSAGSQQCLAYNSSGMEDYSCYEQLPYICFRKSSISDELTECGTVDKEYKLDARTGHCYKFHPVAVLVWYNAAKICHAEGGYLAIIDDEVEADVLKELFAKHPRLLYTPFQNSASIGFRQWGFTKSWWTIHGKRLEDTGYAQWSQGQPDNSPAPNGRASGQECGAIFRTGKLDDMWCDVPLAFICEKSKMSLLHVNDDIF